MEIHIPNHQMLRILEANRGKLSRTYCSRLNQPGGEPNNPDDVKGETRVKWWAEIHNVPVFVSEYNDPDAGHVRQLRTLRT